MKVLFTQAVVIAAMLFSPILVYSQTNCYSVSDAQNEVYVVNTSTAAITLVGSTDVGNIESSTLNFSGDTLFTVNDDDFGWLNLQTGEFNVIGDLGTLQNGAVDARDITDIDAMTTGPDGSIYAVERYSGGDLIFKVNSATGSYISNAFGSNIDYIQLSTPEGVSNRLDAIAMSPVNGIMYASANGQSSSASNNNIITIDMSTGVGTLIGNAGVGDLEGMTFKNTGELLMTSGKDGSNTNNLYTINLSTGNATLIGSLSEADFETLACPCIDSSANTILGKVFWDTNLDTTLTLGETLKSGIQVKLYDDVNNNGIYDAGDQLIDSTQTDGLGSYIFKVSYTSGTDYFLISTTFSDYPTGSSLTTDNIETAVFSTGGNMDVANNFGYAAFNVISGTVFIDPDRDGILDGGEFTSQGRTIKLYKDENCNGVVDGADAEVASTTTDDNGNYEFTRGYVCIENELSIQPSSADSRVKESSPTSTSGSDTYFEVNANIPGHIDRGMVKFDLSSIPSGSTITSAELSLYLGYTDAGAGTTRIHNVHRITEDWTEEGASWNNRGPGNWSSAGGSFNTTPTASQTVNTTYEFKTWAVITDVQAFVTGSSANYGWMIKDDEVSSTSDKWQYRTREYSTVTKRPKLVVTYEVAALCNDCYVILFESSQLTNDSTLTTPSTQTAQFSSGGNTDPNNDFGYFHPQPVPVEMIHFSGKLVDSYVELIWVTASEINNNYFDVQRSPDGIKYTSIDRVPGSGTTQQISDYIYIDTNPLIGVSYYRLEQVDFNGEWEMHGPVVLHQENTANGISVFPNPANERLKIVLASKELLGATGEVSIYDIQGRLVRTTTLIGGSGNILIDDLPRGMYRIRYNSTATVFMSSFIIDR